ncbi:Uncharacterized protein BN871_KJ_00010 [Paenibacillus sp. P22]|nr:Uncharacterized protein BN871_KJ_00010 [Paenibacillus sp. P22]
MDEAEPAFGMSETLHHQLHPIQARTDAEADEAFDPLPRFLVRFQQASGLSMRFLVVHIVSLPFMFDLRRRTARTPFAGPPVLQGQSQLRSALQLLDPRQHLLQLGLVIGPFGFFFLDDFGRSFGREAFVGKLFVHALHFGAENGGFLRQPRDLLFDVDESRKRQVQLRPRHNGGHRLVRSGQSRVDRQGGSAAEAAQKLFVAAQDAGFEAAGRLDLQLDLLAHRHVHFGADVAHGADRAHEQLHLADGFRSFQRSFIDRPGGRRDGLALMRQMLPDFLADERHERMDQALRPVQHVGEHGLRRLFGVGILTVQIQLGNLDVPVAQIVPDEIVQQAACFAEVVGVDQSRHIARGLVQTMQDPAVGRAERNSYIDIIIIETFQIHQGEAGSVPDLVGEVSRLLYLLQAEPQILPRRAAGGQHEAHRIRTVLLDDVQRIDSVAERLGHLLAVRVAHQAVHEHVLERDAVREFQRREDHAGYPEVDDVVAGDKQVVRIVALEIGAVLVRPAERGERPKGGAEPGVENVLVAAQLSMPAVRASFEILAGDMKLAAGVAVPGRNAMAPPQLAGNAPVADVLDPVQVDLLEAVRHEVHALAGLLGFDRAFGERLHCHEPLRGQVRLDDGAAALAVPDLMHMVLDADENAALLKVGDKLLARFGAVEALVRSGLGVHDAALVHDDDLGQAVALADLEVVRIMGRRDLDRSGAEVLLDIIVCDDRNLASGNRKHEHFSDESGVALILRMHRYSRVAEHRLGTGRRDGDVAGSVRKRIFQVVQVSVHFLVLDLDVGQGRARCRIPVDDLGAAIDQPFLVQADEHLANGFGKPLVQREALAGVVQGKAHLAPLAADRPRIRVLPLPYLLQEFLAAQIVARHALLAKLLLHYGLRRDAGMVRSGQPQGVVSLHALRSDHDILQREIERMPDMEHSRYVGGRDDDRVRLRFRLAAGLEETALFPELGSFLLRRLRIVGRRHFRRVLLSL